MSENNNPVQVILNAEQFISDVEPSRRSGINKDFYSNNNENFIKHKERIISDLDRIYSGLEKSEIPICYAKVGMRSDAIAKSYRPVSIFAVERGEEDAFVGGGKIGEIFVELTPERICSSKKKIQKAEDFVVKKNPKTGALEASVQRSEVGAMESISEYSPEDRKKFSTEEAVDYFKGVQRAIYIVKLFKRIPSNAYMGLLPKSTQELFYSFINGITAISEGLLIKDISLSNSLASTLEITVSLPDLSSKKIYNYDLDIHDRLLNFLSYHPLVRKILLAPKVSLIKSGFAGTGKFFVDGPDKNINYPLVGIIDGGVSKKLDDWVVYRYSEEQVEDEILSHGTSIAGLVSFGQKFNGDKNCKEQDGCLIADINLFDKDEIYIDSDLLDALECAIRQAIVQTKGKLRIFNLSLNVETGTDNYDEFTKRLDKIAEEQNVIIVISAGNCSPYELRPEWVGDVEQNIRNLQSYNGDDIVTSPAMSVRNISVGALNPIDDRAINFISLAPTNYTRRGMTSKILLKPDLAYVGGRGVVADTGLLSLKPSGEIGCVCGTSFSAPLVARTLASLDNEIVGRERISRETLLALLVHSASIPDFIKQPEYKNIGQDFFGFGIPGASREILSNDDHEIRLVFNSVLLKKKQMVFYFDYPSSLVTESGGIIGEMFLTLVSTPPIDDRFEAERVRVNVKAQIYQYNSQKSTNEKMHYDGRLKSVFVSDDDLDKTERNLINSGLKWGSIKKYHFRSSRGKGASSSMKLVVSYESRENVEFPDQGIPFSLILTIRDLDRRRSIFAEMCNQLQTSGINIASIQTANVVRV